MATKKTTAKSTATKKAATKKSAKSTKVGAYGTKERAALAAMFLGNRDKAVKFEDENDVYYFASSKREKKVLEILSELAPNTDIKVQKITFCRKDRATGLGRPIEGESGFCGAVKVPVTKQAERAMDQVNNLIGLL